MSIIHGVNKNLSRRIDALEKRVEELERRPVYVPQFYPSYPTPPWPSPPWTITCADKSAVAFTGSTAGPLNFRASP